MSNDKQSSIEWLIEHYTFADLTAESWEMIKQQAREMYKDEMEAAIIKQCAEQSTSNASAYSDGYSEGYKTALQLVKWKIDNELRTNTQ